jgi:hypothetical protein
MRLGSVVSTEYIGIVVIVGEGTGWQAIMVSSLLFPSHVFGK